MKGVTRNCADVRCAPHVCEGFSLNKANVTFAYIMRFVPILGTNLIRYAYRR